MWKDVKGYEGIYKISENGEVLSLGRLRGAVKGKDRLLKYDISNSGYYRVTLSKNDKRKRFSVHRLVYENFVGEIPEGLVINHIDENRFNNNYKNLEACTQKQNNHHSRDSLGYKLFEEDIISIRERKLTVKEIVSEYKISPRHALRIIKNERWVM